MYDIRQEDISEKKQQAGEIHPSLPILQDHLLSTAALLAALFTLYLIYLHNYLLFHTLAEMFCIIIAGGIFMIAWNSRRFLQNHYLLFIGIAYVYVGALDLFHTLAYQGMGIFQADANLPTQLWIAARYIEALSLLFAVFFLHRKLAPRRTFLAFGVSSALLLTSIFYWKNFPVCFIEGTGLTPFKIYSEYAICLILLAAVGLLIKNARTFDRNILTLLIAAIATTIVQELTFTNYLNVYGASNMVGHLIKIISFYLLYRAIIKSALVSPYDLLFRDLKQSEERYSELIQNANSAIIRWSEDGTVNLFNEYAQILFGWKADEIIGRSITLLLPDQAAGDDNSKKLVTDVLENPERHQHHINENICRNGRHVWMSWSNQAVLDDSDRVVEILSVGSDITELKRTEEALLKAHDDLEMRVEERTAGLRKKDQLLLQQSRQAAMGEMISNIAHQWRQPLNALGLIVQSLFMKFEAKAGEDDEIESMNETAMQMINHMSRTIDDFRDYFRPDKDKTSFHLSDPVSNTINLIGESFRNLGIEIKVEALENPAVQGYPNEFAQVLLNILNNARDIFTERMVSQPKISITLGRKNGKALLTIGDNGGGIAEGVLEKVFDPYFTTKAPDKGTGIGLFMSKNIIEKNMGGRLIARNITDGAEFRIEL